MTHAASMDTDTEKEETFAEPLLSDQQETARSWCEAWSCCR